MEDIQNNNVSVKQYIILALAYRMSIVNHKGLSNYRTNGALAGGRVNQFAGATFNVVNDETYLLAKDMPVTTIRNFKLNNDQYRHCIDRQLLWIEERMKAVWGE